MARRRKIPASFVVVVLGVIGTLFVLWWTPWNLVNPFDPTLIIATVHAPLWERPMSPAGHFEVDGARLTIWLVALWAAVGIWLGLSSNRWS